MRAKKEEATTGGVQMEDAVARGFANLIGRLDGPMHLRFIVQPAVATLLAIRAGVRDALAGEPPFLVAIRSRDQRRARLLQAWHQISKVFFMAVLLDAIYQIRVHHGIYPLEMAATAILLALVPYGLVRGPAARVARAWVAAKDRRARDGHSPGA